MSSSYIELHTASAFSFLQGASLPESIVERAADLGYPAVALLDRDGVYGAPRFHKAATAAGLRAIIGAELSIAGAGGAGEAGSVPTLQPWVLPVLCESQESVGHPLRFGEHEIVSGVDVPHAPGIPGPPSLLRYLVLVMKFHALSL